MRIRIGKYPKSSDPQGGDNEPANLPCGSVPGGFDEHGPGGRQPASVARIRLRRSPRHTLLGENLSSRLELAFSRSRASVIASEVIQTYYSHNFISIDDQPIDPQYQITFGQLMIPGNTKPAVRIAAKRMFFNRPVKPGESFLIRFGAGPYPASANRINVWNQSTGAGIRITGNAGRSRFHVWTTDRVVCPEPFVAMRLGPGGTFQWTDQYQLLVNPERKKP